MKDHLNFKGDSAYVSTSRSETAAKNYMYGRTGERGSDGYVYVMDAQKMNDGHWMPGKYGKDPAVQRNQEFAVDGAVKPESIVGAYHYKEGNSRPDKWIKNPNYAKEPSSPQYKPSSCDKNCVVQ